MESFPLLAGPLHREYPPPPPTHAVGKDLYPAFFKKDQVLIAKYIEECHEIHGCFSIH